MKKCTLNGKPFDFYYCKDINKYAVFIDNQIFFVDDKPVSDQDIELKNWYLENTNQFINIVQDFFNEYDF